ncbi:MAG: aldehyde dehydrogenase family protein [Candidatus Bathyarchaeia archaeon]
MVRTYRNYINGEWPNSSNGETLARENPATGEPVATVQKSSREDVEAAINAARQAFDSGVWSEVDAADRARVMYQVSEILKADKERLARLLTIEKGFTLSNSVAEVKKATDTLVFYAGLATVLSAETANPYKKHFHLVCKEPVGVCALIAPFNYPIDLLMRKLAPALAAGCTVVIKPSSYTSGITMEVLSLFDKVKSLPKGVINCVTGPGGTIGVQLAKSSKVDKIGFTGSTSIAKEIMGHASGNLKKLSLECGGKSPNIVFEDADFDKAVMNARDDVFSDSGQGCADKTRLLLHEDIHDSFLEKLIESTRKLKVGNGLDASVDVGPVVSEAQMQKIIGYIESGEECGAKLVVGGKRIMDKGLDRGYFVEPTIFDKVPNDAMIAQEEIFGPVIVVMSFKDEEEAIGLANDTPYGLSSSLWTKDITRAIRVARKIRAGEVMINTAGYRLFEYPFGGYKQSGIGREFGALRAIEEYTQTKHIAIDL